MDPHRPNQRTARPTVGIIGLGIMGGVYARHLAEAGYSVLGFDIDPDRLARARAVGAVTASAASEVVDGAEVVIISLSSLAAFRTVMLGPDAASRQARPGQLFIETGTIPIDLKTEVRDRLLARGAAMLDAPVTGTRVHAEEKKLVVYGSGTAVDFERAQPIMSTYAHEVRYVGPFGAGMKLKIVTNLLVAVHTVATAEALSLARSAGLDLQLVYDLIDAGPAGSTVFSVRGPLMVAGNYTEPGMRMDVFSKDVELIGTFARSIDAATPLFRSSEQIFHAALARGLRAEDISAVFEIIAAKSGRPVEQPKVQDARDQREGAQAES